MPRKENIMMFVVNEILQKSIEFMKKACSEKGWKTKSYSPWVVGY